MAGSRKKRNQELLPQPDARAPLDAAAFLRAARPVLAALTVDLLARADASEGRPPGSNAVTHAPSSPRPHRRGLPGLAPPAVVVQVAAAWLLSCVFVRVLEDRGLSLARIAGPGARDSEEAFFRSPPSSAPREYLLTVFRELTRLPATSPAVRRQPQPRLAPRHRPPRPARRCSTCSGAAHRHAGVPFRPARHPLPRGPLPGSRRRRPRPIRAAANPRLRRALHPRPHARAGPPPSTASTTPTSSTRPAAAATSSSARSPGSSTLSATKTRATPRRHTRTTRWRECLAWT
jgi:hypothetical protein